MKGFEPVTLTWKGAALTVAPEDQLFLIAEIEDALRDASGLPAVSMLLKKGGPSYARLSAAYGAALRYAGHDVTDAEIYLTISEAMAEGKSEITIAVQNAVLGILSILSPPVYRKIHAAAQPPGKPKGGKAATPAA